MSERLAIYNNGLEVLTAFTPFYQETAVEKIRSAGAVDGWHALILSAGAEPDPLTWERLTALSPYNAPGRLVELVGSAVEGGFLTGDKESGFRLTDSGRTVLAAFFDTAQDLLGSAPTLSSEEMGRLAVYLKRIVAATETLDDPSQKPNLQSSRWTDPGDSAPAAVRIDQYMTDLRLFRDDAHTTAWQVYDIDGRSWEALTFIWRDDAHTAAALLEKLPHRGWTADDYAASLALLADKGLIEEAGAGWQITDAGRVLRQHAEDETDRIFFAGWHILDKTELDDTNELLERLLGVLNESAPEPELA